MGGGEPGVARTHAAPDVRRYGAARADQTADEKKDRLKLEQGDGQAAPDGKHDLFFAKPVQAGVCDSRFEVCDSRFGHWPFRRAAPPSRTGWELFVIVA